MEIGELKTDTLVVAQALERFIQWLRDEREPPDIGATALSTLNRLGTFGPLRITELAELEGMTQPGMTLLIHRMESAGFAVRGTDPVDRRGVRVSITPKGIDRISQHRNSRAAVIGTRIEQLAMAERSLLLSAVPALNSFTSSTTMASPIESR